jgi:hypothetical protein
MGLSEDHMAHAMLAAGLIGVFICARSTFAAEVCGCMAECGSGSGMAAAALVTLAGGSAQQAVDAASMALQNTLGLICDPVANRVEPGKRPRSSTAPTIVLDAAGRPEILLGSAGGARIILTALFYLVMTPVGLIMRLFRDPLDRSLHDRSTSQWIKRESLPVDPERYEPCGSRRQLAPKRRVLRVRRRELRRPGLQDQHPRLPARPVPSSVSQ